MIAQGVLKWSRVLVTVIVLLINATRTACVLNLISVPCRALGNVLILLTLKPVVKLFCYLYGQEIPQEAVWKWWCKTWPTAGFPPAAAHPHAWALGIVAVLWDLLLTCHGDKSGVSGQQNWIVTQRFKNDWVSNFPCSFITVSFAPRIIYCGVTSSMFSLLFVTLNFNKKGLV